MASILLTRQHRAAAKRRRHAFACESAQVGPADAREQLVGHGRALHRVWLALTRRGLYTHPLSQIIDCSATERELSARLGVDDGLRPLSVFRVGRSEAPAESHRMR